MEKTARREGASAASPGWRSKDAPTPPGDHLVGVGLFLGFALLYLATLCPTTYVGDSGEIAAAIATGGIIHPPGYPLFGLLGRLALILIPVGEPAFRIGCVVAFAAAAAVAVLYRLCREMGISAAVSTAAAATFGAGYSFWSQSVRVEVYSLHVLLATTCLFYALSYGRGGRMRDLLLAAIAFSLGLAHHLTIVLLLPGLLILCGRRLWTDPGAVRRIAFTATVVLLVGPLLYIALFPLWARDATLHNFGRPATLPTIWAHASARYYRCYLLVPNATRLASGLRQISGLAADNLPLGTFVLSLLGSLLLWRRDPRAALGLATAALAVTGYNLCYQIDDIAVYYLMVWLVASVLLAATLEWLRERVEAERPAAHAALLTVCAVLPTFQILRNHAACDLHTATFVRDFARHKLEHCDPSALLLTRGDDDVWYVHDVLGVRPDVLEIDRDLVAAATGDPPLDPSRWYLYRLRALGVAAPLDVPQSHEAPRRAVDAYLIGLLMSPELRDRTLCTTFSAGNDADMRYLLTWMRQSYDMSTQGLVLRLRPKGSPVRLTDLIERNRQLWNATALPTLGGIRTDQDREPTYITNHYATMLVNYGHLYELARAPETAERIFTIAAKYAPANAAAARALARVRSQHHAASAASLPAL